MIIPFFLLPLSWLAYYCSVLLSGVGLGWWGGGGGPWYKTEKRGRGKRELSFLGELWPFGEQKNLLTVTSQWRNIMY